MARTKGCAAARLQARREKRLLTASTAAGRKRLQVEPTRDCERDDIVCNKGYLCLRCRKIDLDTIFALRGVARTGLRVRLGKVEDWHKECALCDFWLTQAKKIYTTLGRDRLKHMRFSDLKWQLRILDLNKARCTPLEEQEKPMTESLPAISIWPIGLGEDHLLNSIGYQFIVRSSTEVLPTWYEPRKFGVDTAARNFKDSHAPLWVEECLRSHDDCEGPRNDSTMHMSCVIDCETRSLIGYEGGDYLALSYVWGSRSPLTLEEYHHVQQTGQLPTKVPQTIQDAMTVTLGLGYRYFWCDRFCISQYHSEQKIHQLRSMADIYAQATLTIVALSEDADSGLHGISVPRVEKQMSLTSTAHRYCGTLPPLSQGFGTSVYRSRAWTFQEARLSKRCLIFSPYQTHYICRRSHSCETFPVPLSRRYFQGQYSSPLSKIRLGTWVQDDLGTGQGFNSAINEYLRRQLTDRGDALNAFRGILTKLDIKTYFGLPCAEAPKARKFSLSSHGSKSDASAVFLKSLAWRSDVSSNIDISRKEAVPSWTWASASAKVVMDAGKVCPSNYISGQCPEIYVRNKGTWVPLDDHAEASASQMLMEPSHAIMLTSVWVMEGLQLVRMPSQTGARFDVRKAMGQDIVVRSGTAYRQDVLLDGWYLAKLTSAEPEEVPLKAVLLGLKACTDCEDCHMGKSLTYLCKLATSCDCHKARKKCCCKLDFLLCLQQRNECLRVGRLTLSIFQGQQLNRDIIHMGNIVLV